MVVCVLFQVVNLLGGCKRQNFPSFLSTPTPTPIMNKRPKCQQGIEQPRAHDTGKTLWKQLKQRERNRKGKQWRSTKCSPMKVHKHTWWNIPGFDSSPAAEVTDATEARRYPGGLNQTHDRKPVGVAPRTWTFASRSGQHVGWLYLFLPLESPAWNRSLSSVQPLAARQAATSLTRCGIITDNTSLRWQELWVHTVAWPQRQQCFVILYMHNNT